MPDETSLPDDEFERAVKRYIAAGATEGAAAAARRLVEAAKISLDEVTTALQALEPKASPQTVTGSLSMRLPTIGFSGSGSVTHHGAAALSGSGTLSVSRADVATAVEEIRAIREPDVEKLAVRPPAKWNRPQLILVAVLLVIDVFLLLPAGTRQYLLDGANLLQGIEAIVTLLSKP